MEQPPDEIVNAPKEGEQSRAIIPVLAAVGLAIGAIGAWFLPPAERTQPEAGSRSVGNSNLPRHVRIVWTNDPARSATVLWTTDAPGDSQVYMSTVRRNGAVDLYPSSRTCDPAARYSGAADYVHRCTVDGLEPSTRYFILPSTEGRHAGERWFLTAPEDDRPFRLLFGGDSRSDRPQRRRMNRLMARLLEADEGIIALGHGGDYVANGGRWHHWRAWLEDHGLTTTRDGRLLPIIPTRGNHEAAGPLFGTVFGMPGSRHYFLTKIGRFSLITLNTEISLAGDQRQWLSQALSNERARARWLTAQYHRAAHPAVKPPNPALKKHWVPLFERHSVDLVFESDGHALKRTVPIRKGKRDPTGVTYVGEGGLGVAQRRTDPTRWYFENGGLAASQHHVQVLAVSPTSLDYRAVAPDGRTVDRHQLVPRQQAETDPQR